MKALYRKRNSYELLSDDHATITTKKGIDCNASGALAKAATGPGILASLVSVLTATGHDGGFSTLGKLNKDQKVLSSSG